MDPTGVRGGVGNGKFREGGDRCIFGSVAFGKCLLDCEGQFKLRPLGHREPHVVLE